YVVDPAKCNHCLACIPPCPTGSIDNWRRVLKVRAYSVQEQLGWDVLPGEVVFNGAAFSATLPPWSAAHAYCNLYGPKGPTAATVVGNFRVTEVGKEYDTHHI